MVNKKGSEMTEFEKNALGMSYEDVRRQYLESMTAKLSGIEMVVAGILSDCQELLEMRGPATIDQAVIKQLNIAKCCLFETMKDERV